MGYLAYQNANVTLTASASETARFGFKTDRLIVGVDALESAGSLDALGALVRSRIETSTAAVTILRYPSQLVRLLATVGVEDARVFPGGSLTYWEAPSSAPTHPGEAVLEIGLLERSVHAQSISAVLRSSFHGYVNHYSANPLIPEALVTDAYVEWAASTLANPSSRAFANVIDDELVGVAIVGVERGLWEIELASISSRFQSRGLYLQLMSGVLSAAHSQGARRVVISTQSHNIAVQRAWAKLGFKPYSSIETVHLLRD